MSGSDYSRPVLTAEDMMLISRALEARLDHALYRSNDRGADALSEARKYRTLIKRLERLVSQSSEGDTENGND